MASSAKQWIPLLEASQPSSNITSIMKTGSGRGQQRKGVIIALYQHSPDSGKIRVAQIQGSRKQISLYLSNQSEMVRIDMALSFVNLSALLRLLSKPHSHSFSTNPNPPCYLGSALENLHFIILRTAKSCSLVFHKIGLPILGKLSWIPEVY